MELRGPTEARSDAPKGKAQAYSDQYASALSKADKVNDSKRSAPDEKGDDCDEDQDDWDEMEAGQSKKAAAKKNVPDKSERKQVPEGKPGALEGLR